MGSMGPNSTQAHNFVRCFECVSSDIWNCETAQAYKKASLFTDPQHFVHTQMMRKDNDGFFAMFVVPLHRHIAEKEIGSSRTYAEV